MISAHLLSLVLPLVAGFAEPSAAALPKATEVRACEHSCNAPDRAALARKLFQRGVAALSNADPHRAQQLFEYCTWLAPAWELAYLNWGIAAAEANTEPAQAIAALNKATQLAPNNPRAHYQLGLAYMRAEAFNHAQAAFGEALKHRGDMLDARFQKAVALHQLGNFEAALGAYRHVLDHDRRHTGALLALAELFELLEDLEQTELALLTIVNLQPEIAYHHYRLGEFYDRIGKSKQAQAAFAHADSLDPRPKREMRRLR